MPQRTITPSDAAAFTPLPDLGFGGVDGSMLWHNLTYSRTSGTGSYLLKMAPGASSALHAHVGAEEFLVLEGELVDFDGQIFRTGDHVQLGAGSVHTSLSPAGCRLLVTHWGRTTSARVSEMEPLN